MAESSIVETGLSYRSDAPVRIRVRHRDHRYDLDDDGAAVTLAGTRPGWFDVASQVVAVEGFNVNRRGVVFVPAVEGRGIEDLARRSRAGASRISPGGWPRRRARCTSLCWSWTASCDGHSGVHGAIWRDMARYGAI